MCYSINIGFKVCLICSVLSILYNGWTIFFRLTFRKVCTCYFAQQSHTRNTNYTLHYGYDYNKTCLTSSTVETFQARVIWRNGNISPQVRTTRMFLHTLWNNLWRCYIGKQRVSSWTFFAFLHEYKIFLNSIARYYNCFNNPIRHVQFEVDYVFD